MQQLKCEMCGGADLVKQDGVFVCQNCGCKYSVEEAKKMMNESIENTQKTTTDSKTSQIENLLKLAFHEKKAQNLSKAESICDQIIILDSSNHDAWLLKGDCILFQQDMLLENLKIQQAINCYDKAFKNAPKEEKEHIQFMIATALGIATKTIMDYCCEEYIETTDYPQLYDVREYCDVIRSELFPCMERYGENTSEHYTKIAVRIINAGIKFYNKIAPNKDGKTYHSYKFPAFETVKLLEYAVSLFPKNDTNNIITAYENIITMKQNIESCYVTVIHYPEPRTETEKCTKEQKETLIDEIMEYHKKIKALKPDYVIPERPQATKQGCYVATCVYGSYNCPEVWTLRRFRDNTLAETILGRAFIRTYYAISPTIVKWFGNTSWFKKMWKGTLDRMVSRLHDNGIENTPYEDKNW